MQSVLSFRTICTMGALCLIALMTITAVPPVAADHHVDCPQIENARERLACFDAKYPRDPEKPFILSEPLRPRTAAPIRRPDTPQAPATPAAAVPVPADTPKNEDAPIRGQGPSSSDDKPNKGGFFDNQPDIDFTTTIAAIRAEDQKKMVFRLENGQIWIQTSPRTMDFSEGDTVTIKSARMGGFIMRNQAGTSTRVNRIQ